MTEKEGSIAGPSPPKKPKREGEEEGGLDNESEKEFGEDSLFLNSFCFDENADENSTGLLTKHSCFYAKRQWKILSVFKAPLIKHDLLIQKVKLEA